MMKSKVEIILSDIEKYKSYNLSKLVEERLDNTLNRYAKELDDASDRLRYKNIVTVMRGLNK